MANCESLFASVDWWATWENCIFTVITFRDDVAGIFLNKEITTDLPFITQ